MTYNEWIEKKTGLFSELSTIYHYSFMNDFNADKLDMVYKMKYGEKPVPKALENYSVNDVANIIHITYGDNWDKQYTLLKDEMLVGVDNKKVVDEITSDKTKETMTGSKTNKVSAYNNDVMVDNDSSKDNSDNDTTKDVTRNTTTKNISLNAVQKQLDVLKSNFVLDVVCKDVSKIVSLSIY